MELSHRVVTTIRYDGSALVDHEMDVQELAPALLALAEMIQVTNRKYNDGNASMRVLIRPDVEQHCFQLDLHLVQHFFEAAKTLFASDQYKTAKQIAEDLGLICGEATAFTGGVFLVWKKLFAKKDEQERPLTSYHIEHHGGVTIIQNFYGEGQHVEMPTPLYDLAVDPELVKLGKKVVKPLERNGYETLGFYDKDKQVVSYSDREAERFIKRAPSSSEVVSRPPDALPIQKVDGQVEIYTAQFRGKSQWNLRWVGKNRHMKIEDEDWLERYQAGHVKDVIPGAWLDVHMEIDQATPMDEPIFTIKKVKSVIPPAPDDQPDIFVD